MIRLDTLTLFGVLTTINISEEQRIRSVEIRNRKNNRNQCSTKYVTKLFTNRNISYI